MGYCDTVVKNNTQTMGYCETVVKTQCFLNVFFGPGIKTQRLIYQIHVLLPELIELMN